MEIEELLNILIQDNPSDLIRKNEEKIFGIIPELALCKNFNQNNMWHIYDVYEHILHVVDGVPNNLALRLSALFHDIGKPLIYQLDDNGEGHFYGHWDKSREIFEKFIKTYKLSNVDVELIANLILYHDIDLKKIDEKGLEKLIKILKYNGIEMLFQLKRSDLLAQNEKFHYMLSEYEELQRKILKNKGELIMENIEHIIYTYKHRKIVMLLAEKYFKGNEELLEQVRYHDLDKLFMYLFYNKKDVSKTHRNLNRHHDNDLEKTYLDYIEMVLDWESARYTKLDKPLNAYETLYNFYPHMVENILPILQEMGIDKPGLPMDSDIVKYTERLESISIEEIENDMKESIGLLLSSQVTLKRTKEN